MCAVAYLRPAEQSRVFKIIDQINGKSACVAVVWQCTAHWSHDLCLQGCVRLRTWTTQVQPRPACEQVANLPNTGMCTKQYKSFPDSTLHSTRVTTTCEAHMLRHAFAITHKRSANKMSTWFPRVHLSPLQVAHTCRVMLSLSPTRQPHNGCQHNRQRAHLSPPYAAHTYRAALA